jgi:hypothetical protein
MSASYKYFSLADNALSSVMQRLPDGDASPALHSSLLNTLCDSRNKAVIVDKG